MGLSLVVGPAHVGKVALLLERYLDVLERDPWLVVPNRVDVDRVERDLIRRRPALLAGTIGTFDDIFRHVANGAETALPVAAEAQRAVAVRRAVASHELASLRSSATTAGSVTTTSSPIRCRRPEPATAFRLRSSRNSIRRIGPPIGSSGPTKGRERRFKIRTLPASVHRFAGSDMGRPGR